MGSTSTRIFALGETGAYYRNLTESRWRATEDSTLDAGQVFTYGNTVVFDGGGGNARISFDNGTGWKPLVYGSGELRDWFWLLHVGKQGIFYSAGFSEAPKETFGLYQSSDTGKTWIHHPVPGSVYGVAETGEDLIVSSDSGVYLLRSPDRTLEPIPIGNRKTPTWFRLNGNEAGDVLAGQFGTPVYKFQATSKTWRAVLPGSESRVVQYLDMEGSVAYALIVQGESEYLQRSTDGGSTWESAREIGSRQTTRILAKGESVYLADNNGLEAYHWPSGSWSVDSAGRRADRPRLYGVLGHSVLALSATFKGFTRSDDLGADWKRILSVRDMPAYVFRSRQGVFYQQDSRLIRLDLGTGMPDSLPAFDSLSGVMQVEDAGSRYYARVIPNGGGGGQPLAADAVVTLLKGANRWTSLKLPFPAVEELAGEGDELLIGRKDSLAYSADAGLHWANVSIRDIGAPRSLVHQAGSWIVGTVEGLFRSKSPVGSWNPITFGIGAAIPTGPVEVIAYSANSLLIRSAGYDLHLSTDRGTTWRPLNSPFSGNVLMRADLSDSLVCLSGYAETMRRAAGYCLELGPSTSGIKPAWKKMAEHERRLPDAAGPFSLDLLGRRVEGPAAAGYFLPAPAGRR